MINKNEKKIRKDFDFWNDQKKEIHNFGKNKFYRKREIWWCDLGLNIGFEQDGGKINYRRPVLILKGFSRQVCLVLPLTTSQKENRYYFKVGKVDGKEASIIISQIRLIDTMRLVRKIEELDKKIFDEIRKIVKDLI